MFLYPLNVPPFPEAYILVMTHVMTAPNIDLTHAKVGGGVLVTRIRHLPPGVVINLIRKISVSFPVNLTYSFVESTYYLRNMFFVTDTRNIAPGQKADCQHWVDGNTMPSEIVSTERPSK